MNAPRYSMAWAPARMPFPHSDRPALGQNTFLESPITALVTDVVVLGSTSFFAWGLSQKGNRWGTFWWFVSGGLLLKTLHDIGRS